MLRHTAIGFGKGYRMGRGVAMEGGGSIVVGPG